MIMAALLIMCTWSAFGTAAMVDFLRRHTFAKICGKCNSRIPIEKGQPIARIEDPAPEGNEEKTVMVPAGGAPSVLDVDDEQLMPRRDLAEANRNLTRAILRRDPAFDFVRMLWNEEKDEGAMSYAYLFGARQRQRELERGLFDAIAHGDEKHQAWLKQAIEDHFAGRPVVPSLA